METARDFLVKKEKEAIANRFKIDYIDTLEYDPKVNLEWIRKKSEKKLLRKDFLLTNQWNRALFQEEMKKGLIPNLSIRFVSPLKGFGLFAEEMIAECTFIGEYVGIVKKRIKKLDRDNDYIFEYSIGSFDTGYVIDAEEKGNHTRFINHSYEPNVTSRWIVINYLPRVVYFANRRIEKGEELLLDYGPYYWES